MITFTPAERIAHYDQTRHVHYEEVAVGWLICVDCREIAQAVAQAEVARDWTGEV